MIKKPWPLRWMPIDSKRDLARFKSPSCRFSNRYLMLCGAVRTENCYKCYMRQQAMTDNQRNSLPDELRPIHICDRCGCEIEYVDKAGYLEITNRSGVRTQSVELCEDCLLDLDIWYRCDDRE